MKVLVVIGFLALAWLLVREDWRAAQKASDERLREYAETEGCRSTSDEAACLAYFGLER